MSSFTITFARISKTDAKNMISFQIRVFGRDVKETTLTRYFIEVAAHPSFCAIKSD